MKTRFLLLALIGLFCLGLTSCVVVRHPKHKHKHHPHRKEKPLPPGHAKKIVGDRNATYYAPGQHK